MHLQNDMRWFDRARDMDAIKRIWREVGWVEDRDDELAMENVFSVGKTLTGVVDGVAECAVLTIPGAVSMLGTDLDMCAVAAVTTSRIGRKRRFAQRLTATQLAQGAEDGAAVAMLGMFEQGFYDRVGFGSGAYQNVFTFDPATLRVDTTARTPCRLTEDDWRDMYRCLASRMRGHGGCVLHPPEVVRSELAWTDNGFGLGYRDDDGVLTHFIWCGTENVEHGPAQVNFIAYQTPEQLMELLGLLKSLGDQLRSVKLAEPAHIHLQDWLDKPFRNRGISKGGAHQGQHTGTCWWQIRVLDVAASVAALTATGAVTFRLQLSDPASEVLAGAWPGSAGSYTIQLGEQSHAVREDSSALPTVRASVNAFTRYLFGIVPASVLALADDFDAPAELLPALDAAVRLPPMRPGWDF